MSPEAGFLSHPLVIAIAAPIVVAGVIGLIRSLRAIRDAVAIKIPATLDDHRQRLDQIESRLGEGAEVMASLGQRVTGVAKDLVDHTRNEERLTSDLIDAIREGKPVGRAKGSG